MNRRLPLWVLLASSLVFLASLFLPWRDTTSNVVFGDQGFLNLLAGGSVDGWLALAGDVAVLLVVTIVLATVAALRRPQLAVRLPIGGLGVALGYFAFAVAVEVHTLTREFGGGFTGRPPTPHSGWTYGFYLGLSSAGVAALSALAFRSAEPLRVRGAADAVAIVLGLGLLISFLLPWFEAGGPAGIGIHGIETGAAAIAALVLIPRRRMAAWRSRTAVASAGDYCDRDPHRWRGQRSRLLLCTPVWNVARRGLLGLTHRGRSRSRVALEASGPAAWTGGCPRRRRRITDRGALPALAGGARPGTRERRWSRRLVLRDRNRCRQPEPAAPGHPGSSRARELGSRRSCGGRHLRLGGRNRIP